VWVYTTYSTLYEAERFWTGRSAVRVMTRERARAHTRARERLRELYIVSCICTQFSIRCNKARSSGLDLVCCALHAKDHSRRLTERQQTIKVPNFFEGMRINPVSLQNVVAS
jgi:hypothetical protein